MERPPRQEIFFRLSMHKTTTKSQPSKVVAILKRKSLRAIANALGRSPSTTDPDCGMFVKGEHERQFAYEAHTACDRHGYVLGVDVTAGNVHDSVALLRDGSSSNLLP